MKLVVALLGFGVADLLWLNAVLLPRALAEPQTEPATAVAVAGVVPQARLAATSRPRPASGGVETHRGSPAPLHPAPAVAEHTQPTVNVTDVVEPDVFESPSSKREVQAVGDAPARAVAESPDPETLAAEIPAPAASDPETLPAKTSAPRAFAAAGLEPIRFPSGGVVLSAVSEDALRQLAARLQRTEGLTVRLVGHSDRTGSPRANMRLAERRAEHVREQLVALGVSKRRVFVSAKGAREPLRTGTDPESLAANRRVEIVVTHAQGQP